MCGTRCGRSSHGRSEHFSIAWRQCVDINYDSNMSMSTSPNGPTAWGLSGVMSAAGQLERPVESGLLLVPGTVDLDNDRLVRQRLVRGHRESRRGSHSGRAHQRGRAVPFGVTAKPTSRVVGHAATHGARTHEKPGQPPQLLPTADSCGIELNDAIDIATQVGQGLAKAHAAGIVHCDTKPANLLVTNDGTVTRLDFGLPKLAGGEAVTHRLDTVCWSGDSCRAASRGIVSGGS